MNETELLFFKLSINSKIPSKNEKFSDRRNLKKISEINTRFYNVGLACGANNLLVSDIDEKHEGLREWADYVAQNDEPLTVKQMTPNNGFYYVFYETNDKYTEEQNVLIKR